MKRFFILFLLFPLLTRGLDPDFYVWQRQQTPAVRKAVQDYFKNCSGNLYFLAGELENHGKTVLISPPDSYDPARSIPVIRIHIEQMKRSIPDLAREVKSCYSPWRSSGELQIDLDAPESKLLYYRDLMKELRSILPGVKLSATVLPCHLKKSTQFRELAAVCDYYVLQVHGLTREGNRTFILDRATAFEAVTRAKKLKFPFKTALPLYCDTLRNGEFVKPDLQTVSDLAKVSPAVIGFRLGVPGDGEAIDCSTALKICRGEPYAPSVRIYWRQQKNGAWHCELHNQGFFAEKMTFRCTRKRSLISDSGTFNGAEYSSDGNTLTLTLPPPGESKPYLWLRCGTADPNRIFLFTIQK